MSSPWLYTSVDHKIDRDIFETKHRHLISTKTKNQKFLIPNVIEIAYSFRIVFDKDDFKP